MKVHTSTVNKTFSCGVGKGMSKIIKVTAESSLVIT